MSLRKPRIRNAESIKRAMEMAQERLKTASARTQQRMAEVQEWADSFWRPGKRDNSIPAQSHAQGNAVGTTSPAASTGEAIGDSKP